jgi:hypothetical protein
MRNTRRKRNVCSIELVYNQFPVATKYVISELVIGFLRF